MRAARLYLTAQTEPGHLISHTTTHAAAPALWKLAPDVSAPWIAAVGTRRYDHRQMIISEKTAGMIALGFTEKQGGVEPFDTTTTAMATAGGHHLLTGHKWFLSAPMSDAAIMLAEAPGGPSAFLVPRLRPDGTLNDVRLMRLKATLGLRATAIAEAELAEAEGYLIGGEGEGPQIMTDALTMARLDATIIAAGQMRGALSAAVHHCRHRTIAGERLVDLDLMTRVLADMALDVAAATVLAMRLASAADAAPHDPLEAAYVRLILPAAKYWITKVGVCVAAEALECVGGNGFVEAGSMPRFYRDAPGNALWAGPGNVLALDLLDVLGEDAKALDAVVDELTNELGRDGAVSADVIRAAAKACQDDRGSARILIEQLALAAAAAALHRYSPRAITGAFIETRLSGPWRISYGMLDGRYDAAGIINYAFHGLY
jgi:putative acyl-CoA dehydrogenase